MFIVRISNLIELPMFPDVNQQKIEEELSEEKLKKLGFGGSTNLWCKYCTNREICVDYYACIE